MKTALVTLKATSIGFPEKGNVLHSIDLQINSGEVLAIVGESGSGKSLSALALMGLLPHNAVIGKESKFIWYDEASNTRIDLLQP
jgi:ABC-type microcin C transport system duplicated ATPase subunit YejF